MKKILFSLLFLCFCMQIGNAQILVTRNLTINPFADTTTTQKVLGISAFAAEFSRGYGSTANAHAWNARLIGMFEVYRFSPKTSFVFTTAHEINADLYNSLYFNPKGAIWHESFSVFHRQKNYTLELGISHRCRHNIDNADIDDGDTLNLKNITYRILIVNAPYINVFSNEIAIRKNFSITSSLRAEYFWYAYDSRFPYLDNGQMWSKMKAAFHLTFGATYHFHKYFAAYTKTWLQTMAFSDIIPITNNYRVETGLVLKGEKANLQTFVGYEYFFDDYSHHIPRSSGVLFVGARLGGKVFR